MSTGAASGRSGAMRVPARPIVVIAGRPNVGKSTLVNRIVGRRTAIVEEKPGVTRDRLELDADWRGRGFTLVDTGGVVERGDALDKKVTAQALRAVGDASVVLFVLDATTGLTGEDDAVAAMLRRVADKVLVVANKVDSDRQEAFAWELGRLGFGDPVLVSALHGRGVGDLLDEVVARFPPEEPGEGPKTGPRTGEIEAVEAGPAAVEVAAVAIVGRPNVGKSSLLNALLGEERVIVSDIPGTTRDAIDTEIEWGGRAVTLIDTAGMRRRGRIAGGPDSERFSALRALRALGRCDVAVLVIDAVDGLTRQDAHVAGYVVEEGKGLVLALNKWDLVEKGPNTFDEYVASLRREAHFLDFAPIVAISAKTGQRVGRVLDDALEIAGQRRRRIPTGELNRLLADATYRQAPPSVKGVRLKFYYATQASVAPPTFVLFVSDADAVHFSYARYLENRIRDAFDFGGTPLRLVFRTRSRAQIERRRGRGTSRDAARRGTGSDGRPGSRGGSVGPERLPGRGPGRSTGGSPRHSGR